MQKKSKANKYMKFSMVTFFHDVGLLLVSQPRLCVLTLLQRANHCVLHAPELRFVFLALKKKSSMPANNIGPSNNT
jgi:hypothetical protein